LTVPAGRGRISAGGKRGITGSIDGGEKTRRIGSGVTITSPNESRIVSDQVRAGSLSEVCVDLGAVSNSETGHVVPCWAVGEKILQAKRAKQMQRRKKRVFIGHPLLFKGMTYDASKRY